jgi:uncharacterized protein (DUF2147 family)
MKILLIPILLMTMSAYGQSIIGKWKTIDDTNGKEKSIVEIFEKGDKVHGRIIRIFPEQGEDPDPVCDQCEEDDPRFRKKIIGMEIITSMQRESGQYTNGEILDPENGKVYRCKLWMEGSDLKVRGYWGPFYRTQTWKRAN